MIPVFRPSIGEEELQAVKEVFDSKWLGLGPKVKEFEDAFSRYVGSKYAIGLNSGTEALHLALMVLGIGEGDEVIVPSLTFVSTPHSVVYVGAKPVFCDVTPDTLNMDVDDVRKKTTSRTKAILPMHYAGHPCEMDDILQLAEDEGVYVVEDAAHACGASYRGRKIGSLSHLTCFSFHAVKNLTTGEGGMVTTSNEELADRLRKARWMGIDRDTWSRTAPSKRPSYAWQYTVEELGYKCHMHDISATIGLVQLQKLDHMNQVRHNIFKTYNENLESLSDVQVPIEKDYVESSHHLYCIKCKDRDDLITHLKLNDVAPGVHYYPCHLFPYYKKYRTRLPVTEKIWKEILTLPLFPDITPQETHQVISAVKSFYE